jgi:acyl-coenzyme A thioesterase PaaI-like protein
MNTTADEALIDQATAQAVARRALLETAGTHTSADGWRDRSYFDQPHVFADRGILIGQCNPASPPLSLDWDGERSTGTAVFSTAFEGMPGVLHGGVIAACLDQVLGHALICTGLPGVTGQLTVRYKQICPCDVSLVFTGWVHEDNGRTFTLKGQVHHGERLLATADALFVRIDRDKIEGFVG